MKPKPITANLNFNIIVALAHQHALESHSPLLGNVIEFITDNWSHLDTNTQMAMVRRTMDWIRANAVNGPEHILWKHFCEWAWDELKEPDRRAVSAMMVRT